MRWLTLTPDQGFLLYAAANATYASSCRIAPDGKLVDASPYFDLYVPHLHTGAGNAGMATDTNGWLYVATSAGIQILDQAGRVNAILAPPPGWNAAPIEAPMGAIVFGGAERNILYAIKGNALYRRKTKARGVYPFEAPIKPGAPRL
jgi:sugar lactone lactonase YvrE